MISRVRTLWRKGDRNERGAILVVTALMTVVMIGMAAFSVDLGWLFYRATETKKAAEAAAIAAVVHMPDTAEPMASGTVLMSGDAVDAANAIAAEHGQSVTQIRRWSSAAQIRVDMTDTVPTFFMTLFGIDTVTFDRYAIAEQLPPLKLGSDTYYLGSQPNGGGSSLNIDEHYWLALNGERRQKEDGDPFSTRCTTANHDQQTCQGSNPNFRDPAYYYAVDVDSSAVGQSVRVWLFDAPQYESGNNLPQDTGATAGSSSIDDVVHFDLYRPDATPGDPTDNSASISGCDENYGTGHPGADSWNLLCQFTPTSTGIHVLAIRITGDDTAISAFSMGITNAGNTPRSDVSIYGLGFMSLWMRDVGSTPSFKIVKLEEIYAGTELVISVFDPGDITGNAFGTLTFVGEPGIENLECKVRVSNHAGTPTTGWINDDGTGSGGEQCYLITKNGNSGGNQGIYNNQWVEFAFQVPSDYTCTSCWINVNYAFSSGNPTDRTTWGARINGTPIHLLPDSTPSG